MIGRAPRRVPLISGLLCLAGAISALIFWTAPSSDPLYWLRGAIFGLLAWIGIWDLKVAAFASDDQIQRATSGDVEVWKEHGVAAPSAFKLKDVLFTIYALGILLIFVIVVDWVWGWTRFPLSLLPFIATFALLILFGTSLRYYLRVVRPAKLRIAADQGGLSPADQNDLGITYYNGLGVPQDHGEAMKWFRHAADSGFAPAQSSLGVGYAQGLGVPQDYAEAVRWFRMAADQGDALGQFNLGRAYYKGHGVPQNFAEAAEWFRRAAVRGDTAARKALDAMHANGDL